MKKETLLKRIAKLGLEVEDNGRRQYIVHNGIVASWFYQEYWEEEKKGQYYACNFHTKSVGQESDPHTDYYPGSFWDNASQMLARLVPPVSKFKVGSLVRGKDNKRANRMGYANRMGMVVKAGEKNAHVQWLQPTEAEKEMCRNYPNTYGSVYTTWIPDRDLEIVSAA